MTIICKAPLDDVWMPVLDPSFDDLFPEPDANPHLRDPGWARRQITIRDLKWAIDADVDPKAEDSGD